MKVTYPGFDDFVARWQLPVYRFCLLLVQVPGDARQAVFQTFLYLGALTEALPEGDECCQVFRLALRACRDYFYRKGRRPLRRKELEAALDAPVEPALWWLIRRPLMEKAAFYLCVCLDCPVPQAASALSLPADRVGRLARVHGPHSREQLLRAVADISPDPGWLDDLNDELYLRFEERSVGLENRLRDARLRVDRAVPWIALAILALCLAAVLYVNSLPPVPLS